MSSDKSKGKIVFSGNDIHYPGQTNHDACFIPVSVRQYAGEPLYIIVAHWCLLQQNWVQRNQIAEALHHGQTGQLPDCLSAKQNITGGQHLPSPDPAQ